MTAALAIAACGASRAQAGDVAGPRPVRYACDDGTVVALEFRPRPSTVSVAVGDAPPVVLPRRRSGSGFHYADPYRSLRGKGDEIVWTDDAGVSRVCHLGAPIRIDLGAIGDDGLTGPPEGRRAVSYEFCVPDDPAAIAEVEHIDATVRVHRGSPGRVGCAAAQVLCVGSTHQPDFRGVLRRLAALRSVREIREAHFE